MSAAKSSRPTPRPPRRPTTGVVEQGSEQHYQDAELYDHEYRRRRHDVNWYRALAAEVLGPKDRVLDLACGSGRVAQALVRDGHRVVGLDRSTAMLTRAGERLGRLGREALSRVRLVEGDLRDFELDEDYALIIAAFNSLEHLYTRTEFAACLARVRDHLAPGGRFAFDVQNPDLAYLVRDPTKRWAKTKFRHPKTGEHLIYSTNHDYDPVSQIALIRLYYDPVVKRRGSRSRVVHLSQRKFFPAELEALVAHAGFVVERRHGDFTAGPLRGDAESQVLVCRVR